MKKKEIIENILQSWDTPGNRNNERSWDAIQTKIAAGQQSGKVVKMRSWWIGAAAVAAGICLLLWFNVGGDNLNTVGTTYAMTAPHELPDGSSVLLNGESSLTYDAGKWEDNRSLALQGEAFFQVEKGERFTVETDKGSVAVLGTSFNVRSRNGEFEVACYTGKVEVKSAESTVILTPGEVAVLGENGLEEKETSRNQPDWKSGDFVFNDAPATEVFKELEWHLGVDIETPDVSDLYFEGEFSAENVEEALETVCLSLGLEYEILSDLRILIKRKR